jgi:pimeloyl-ACP methyl ester carboxylesterase
VLPALTSRRDVIAVDLPGFGESAPLPGEVSIATLTDAVEEFIDEQGLGGVDVVGSSMGARMVLEMARRGYPGTVVALDPGGFWSQRQQRIFKVTVGASIGLVRRIQPLLPALTRSRAGRTALLLQFSSAPWRLDPGLVLQELRGFARATSLDEAFDALADGPHQQGAPAGSLSGRVVIGWGRKDRVTPRSEAETAMHRFPDASLHWFDGCGHFPHWDQPDEAVRLILDATDARSTA